MVAIHDRRPSGPRPRTAYLLPGTPAFLLNQLHTLGACSLILREQGLSLARETSFGLFTREAATRWNLLHDAVSSLDADLNAPLSFYLLEATDDACPLLAVCRPGGPVDLTIRLEDHCWESPAVQGLIRSHGIRIDTQESWAREAVAWLDDWAESNRPPFSECLRDELRQRLRKCRLLEVEVTAGTLHATARFQPAFLDTEGSIFRIADAERNHVVFADVADAAFQMETLSPSHLLIHRIAGRHAGVMATGLSAA